MNRELINSKMIELCKKINYEFKNIDWIKKAMQCKKIKNDSQGKNNKTYSNDSLALVGDKILSFIIAKKFYDLDYGKSDISQKIQSYSNNDYLFELRKKYNIESYIYNDFYFYHDAPENNKILASKHDAYIEAIIGAIYYDKGIEYVEDWINKTIIQDEN